MLSFAPMSAVDAIGRKVDAVWSTVAGAFPKGRVGWADHLVGAGLMALYTVCLWATARAIGFGRDESFYFGAARDYAGWVHLLFERSGDALRQGAIDAAWSNNHEHPALMKTLFGVSWYLLVQKWHLVSEPSFAFRLPAMLLSGAGLWILYLFGTRLWGRSAGLVAAFLLGAMPRVFFHAHLACFDAPIMVMWLATVYAYWRAQTTRRLWRIVLAGVVFGLTLETKHNAWMLPAVVVPHALFAERRSILAGLRAGRVVVPATLVSMALIGPLVLVLLWPYLWHDTFARLQWWVEFHTNHVYYQMEFLGRNYFDAPSPRTYLPVMVLATVPTVTILLCALGAVRGGVTAVRSTLARLRGGTGAPVDVEAHDEWIATALLLTLALCIPLAPWLVSSKYPIFGGTKHWFPAYPFVALFAGRGFVLVADAARAAVQSLGARKMTAAQVAVAAGILAAPLAETAHCHPYGLSYYVPFFGGPAGGADLGLNRQFWGYTTQNAAEEYLNRAAPRNASVFIHDTTWGAWRQMQEEGRIRGDLQAAGVPHDGSIGLIHHELHMSEVEYAIWSTTGTHNPVYVVQYDGVPIVSIYRRR